MEINKEMAGGCRKPPGRTQGPSVYEYSEAKSYSNIKIESTQNDSKLDLFLSPAKGKKPMTMEECNVLNMTQLRRAVRDKGWRGQTVDAARRAELETFLVCDVRPGDASVSIVPTMNFSTFTRKTDSTAKPLVLDGKNAFIDLLSKHIVRADKDGELFAPATFCNTRKKDNFISASGICFDFDNGNPSIESVLRLFPNTLAAYYSTFSHGWKSKERKENGVTIPADTTYAPENPRFRVVIPLSRPVNADEHARLVMGVKSIITPELMKCLDLTCFERARPHYLPSCLPGHECHAFAAHQDGDRLDVEYFICLGDAVTAATVASKLTKQRPAPAQQDSQQPSPIPATFSTHEFIDTTTGVVHDLVGWAIQNPTFDILAAIDQQHFRGNPTKDGKQHITCPFEDQHTDQGQDLATFIANASPPQYAVWDIHCLHAHCAGRDRLEFIRAMLGKRWLTVESLQATAPAAIEMKRPPYMNYRAQEYAAKLQISPLQSEEFRIVLQLMHICSAAQDGTLPDDDWMLHRALGLTEEKWSKYRTTLIRSEWLFVENGRLIDPIAKREYNNAQAALMAKATGGRIGGQATQRKVKHTLKDTS